MSFLKYHIRDQEFWLLPEKAMYWPARRILLVADLHIGKPAHFRKNGMYVPVEVMQHDLYKLDTLMDLYPTERILFLGDLFHSFENHEWNLFGDWLMEKNTLQVDLIKGNHDILSIDRYSKYGVVLHHELKIDAYLFRHKPLKVRNPSETGYVICGHIHPAIELQGKARQYIKLECFYFSSEQGILPAFGSFTGNGLVRQINPSDRIFAIAENKIVELPGGSIS